MVQKQYRRTQRKTSHFRGVSAATEGRWRVVIREGLTTRTLGSFNSAEEAAEVYDRWAIGYIGPNALINHPERRTEYVEEVAHEDLSDLPGPGQGD